MATQFSNKLLNERKIPNDFAPETDHNDFIIVLHLIENDSLLRLDEKLRSLNVEWS